MSICVENVSYIYGKGTPFEKAALSNVSLTIEKGEFIGIIGHTGSGKSTLIQHLNGLLHPTEGRVTVDGVDLAGKSKEALAKRHSVGMVFQYPEHQLFEETVAKDIAFGPHNQGYDEEEIKKRVKSAMKFAGIDYEMFAERSPFWHPREQESPFPSDTKEFVSAAVHRHRSPAILFCDAGKYPSDFRQE